MIRGTTAPFIFNIPDGFGDVNKAQVIFWQKDNVGTTSAPMPIKKEYNNLTTPNVNDGFEITETTISVVLNPEETLRFSDAIKAYVQIKIYNDDTHITYASYSQRFTVYPILDTELFDDEAV